MTGHLEVESVSHMVVEDVMQRYQDEMVPGTLWSPTLGDGATYLVVSRANEGQKRFVVEVQEVIGNHPGHVFTISLIHMVIW